MRTVLLLLTVALVIFIAVNRQRIYLRDPLAKVYVNGAKVEGGAAYINASNDVLVDGAGSQRVIVQHWNLRPGVPVKLTCILILGCMTEAEHVPFVQEYGSVRHGAEQASPAAVMTDRLVTFTSDSGKTVRVELR